MSDAARRLAAVPEAETRLVPTLEQLVAAMDATQAAYEHATNAWIVAGELADRANDRRLDALEARDAAIDAYRRNRTHATTEGGSTR